MKKINYSVFIKKCLQFSFKNNFNKIVLYNYYLKKKQYEKRIYYYTLCSLV